MSTPTANPAPLVYAAISEVQRELAIIGIAKGRRNQQQNFNFRGIDDVQNAMAPLLSKHNLVIIPRVISRECTERKTAKGGITYNVVLNVEYRLISTADGSETTASMIGEANDSQDKATNKAFSAAFKYLVLQAFCVPLEGQPDADADHEEAEQGSTVINADQAAEVVQLMEQAGADMGRFFKAYNVQSIGELTTAQLPVVLRQLHSKIAKAQAA